MMVMKKMMILPIMLILMIGAIACSETNDDPTPPPPGSDTLAADTAVIPQDTINPLDTIIDGGFSALLFKEDRFEYPYTREIKTVGKYNSTVIYTFDLPSEEISTVLYTKGAAVQEVQWLKINGEEIAFEKFYVGEGDSYGGRYDKVVFQCGELDYSESGSELNVRIDANETGSERCIEVHIYGVSSTATLRFIQSAE